MTVLTAVRQPAAAREARLRTALAALGVLIGAILIAAVHAGAEPFQPDAFGPGQDARAYWAVVSDAPYRPDSVGSESAYLYSPAFLQLLAPLRTLPWDAFLTIWTALLLAAALVLARPLLLAPVLVLAVVELWGGNIHLLLALAVVVGFRYPAAWAFVLLTKVTPGVGLLWFVVRREWRQLGIALGATALVAGASWLLAPELWSAWVALLVGSVGASTVAGSVPIPLLVRLPVAVALIVWAARGDRRWVLPIATLVALPVIWWGSVAMLAGVIALRRAEAERLLLRALRSAPSGDPREREPGLPGT